MKIRDVYHSGIGNFIDFSKLVITWDVNSGYAYLCLTRVTIIELLVNYVLTIVIADLSLSVDSRYMIVELSYVYLDQFK